MRYATFSTADDPRPRLGLVDGDAIVDVQRAIGQAWPGTLLELIQNGPDGWRRLASAAREQIGKSGTGRYAAAAARWHAPIPRPPKNIVCLGLNYTSHIVEQTKPDRKPFVPETPVFFTKAPTSVTGPFDPIPWDRSLTGQLDYEVELGVVIGVGGKNIPKARALEHVFGYTILNDVSARDLQSRHKQWFKGKSLDGFCPMGPVVVTADEYGDPQSKRISLRVNDDLRQNASTGDMIFAVDAIIESLSQGLTIEAGDIIATGTPEGVGFARTPPEYLKDGDVVEAELEGIGMLRNTVVGEP